MGHCKFITAASEVICKAYQIPCCPVAGLTLMTLNYFEVRHLAFRGPRSRFESTALRGKLPSTQYLPT